MKQLPIEFQERMKTLLGDEYNDFLLSYDEKPIRAFRVNTDKISLEDFEKLNIFSNEKIPYVENGFYFDYDGIGNHPYHHAGMFYIQEPAAMVPVESIDIQPDWKVLDLCAAPGGKSIHISEMLKDEGLIISRDLTWAKVDLIEDNIQRLGAENIQAECQDALVFVPEDKETADVVIADLPCSGLGVIGRKADIKYRVTPEDLTSLAELQRDILTVVSQYVKPNGVLIYSTCTVNREENQENVQWFEKNFPFKLESLEDYLPEGMCQETVKQGYVQLLPGDYDTDGFFIARFRKN